MIQIRKYMLPISSSLNGSDWDYSDSFSGELFTTNQIITPNILAYYFFNSAPTWVESLFNVRNKIVKLFGLKTPNKTDKIQDFEIKKDQIFGIFHVYDITENEVILGETDKHLDFKVSIFYNVSVKSEIIISTVVKYNHWSGKFYFTFIKLL